MSVLSLQNVTKSYFIQDRELPILKGLSLSIEPQEFVAIVGPSGSGKSTLLHLMGALDKPTSGEIKIANHDITKLNDFGLAQLRNKFLGFVFQNFFLLNYYSALDNVCLPLVYAGTERNHREDAAALLRDVGLGDRLHHKPNELSGGERQRVAIARALINRPQLLFADEPTGNLDSKTGETIMRIIEEINQHGTTVVLITHDSHIADRAHRIVRIEDGQFV